MSEESGPDHGRLALGGWLVLAVRQGALSLLTVAGVVVLSRLLGPSDFALYGYATIGVTLALAVGDLGLGARLIRDGESDPVALGRLFGAQLVMVGALSVGSAVAIALFGDGARTAAALIVAAIVLAALQALPTAELERRLAFRAISQIEVGQRVVFVTGAVAIAVAGGERLAIPVAAAVAGVAGYAAVVRLSRWSIRPRFAQIPAALGGFGSQWWQGRLATQIAYAAYPVLGGLLLGARDVGYVVLALTVTSFAVLLAPLVARATFPAMSAAPLEDRVVVFRRVFRAFALVSLPALGFVVACADEIIEIAFGEAWEPAAGLLRATCAPTLLGVVLTPSLPLLYLALEPHRVKRVLMGWAAGQWVLTFPLVAVLGVYALPVAGFLGAAVAILLLDADLARATGLSLVRELAGPVAAAAAATGAGAAVAVLVSGPWAVLPATLVLIAVYGGLLGAAGQRFDVRDLTSAFMTTVQPERR